MRLDGKKLLVLGGTQISCEIIRAAKKMGCLVGVTDYNPIEKSPGKRLADTIYDISVADVDEVVKLIHHEKIDGVITGFGDIILPYYADICEKAGLPSYGTRQQFETFINKERYKPLLRRFGIPTVEEYEVDINRFDETTSNIHYPVLVKPADSSGARGISICNDKEQLKVAINKAKSFSKTGIVLVERYIEGREVTVFWLFKDGKYYLTGIGNRHVKYNQEGVIPLPVGYTYPASITNTYRETIEEKCKEMFRSQGIRNGMMFMQCKVEGGVPIVYDIGFRFTGTLEYYNFKQACDFDPMEMMISFALTGSMGEPDLEQKVDPAFHGRYGFNVSCLSAPGKIDKLLGRDEVLGFPEVAASVIAHYPGETITEAMKGLLAQITIRTLGTVNTEDELYPTMKKIEKTIQILSPEGKNLMLPGIEPEDIAGYVM